MSQEIVLFVVGAVVGAVSNRAYFLVARLLKPKTEGREQGAIHTMLLPLAGFLAAWFAVRLLSDLARSYQVGDSAVVGLRLGFVVGVLLPAIWRREPGRSD